MPRSSIQLHKVGSDRPEADVYRFCQHQLRRSEAGRQHAVNSDFMLDVVDEMNSAPSSNIVEVEEPRCVPEACWG
jgi:hypothetical protein